MDDLELRFTYHQPKGDQPEMYASLRSAHLAVARMIDQYAPESREKSLAITKLEESVFWANAAIARHG